MNLPALVIFLGLIAFVLVHLCGGRLSFLSKVPRSAWLPAAGSRSAACAFVHLPGFSTHQEIIAVRARDLFSASRERLAGGDIPNMLKEVSPEEVSRHFLGFAPGGSSYAALLPFTE